MIAELVFFATGQGLGQESLTQSFSRTLLGEALVGNPAMTAETISRQTCRRHPDTPEAPPEHFGGSSFFKLKALSFMGILAEILW